LKTEIGLINDPYLWKVTGIMVAVVGKFLGSALAQNLLDRTGKTADYWCLDEHKGLMELIVLNIGLELKVLTPEVFTMMVIMALVTTDRTCFRFN
jgi:Kef-type K+ transport system membrane component KefB